MQVVLSFVVMSHFRSSMSWQFDEESPRNKNPIKKSHFTDFARPKSPFSFRSGRTIDWPLIVEMKWDEQQDGRTWWAYRFLSFFWSANHVYCVCAKPREKMPLFTHAAIMSKPYSNRGHSCILSWVLFSSNYITIKVYEIAWKWRSSLN